MMGLGKIICKILADHGINDDHARYADLVKAIDALCDDVETKSHDDGYSSGYDEGVHDTAPDRDEITEEIRAAIESDIETFASLAQSDPQSAAVYFHRATGKHIFEVQQPCLL